MPEAGSPSIAPSSTWPVRHPPQPSHKFVAEDEADLVSAAVVANQGWGDDYVSDLLTDPQLDLADPLDVLWPADLPASGLVFDLPEYTQDDSAADIAAVQAAWGALSKLADPGFQPSPVDIDMELEQLTAAMPDPSIFHSGRLRQRLAAWVEYFNLSGNDTRMARRVLQWVAEGVKFSMVSIDHPAQDKVPQKAQKLAAVQQMLKRACPGVAPEQILAHQQPQQVRFPNHRSTLQYSDFVQTEIQQQLRMGVIR